MSDWFDDQDLAEALSDTIEAPEKEPPKQQDRLIAESDLKRFQSNVDRQLDRMYQRQSDFEKRPAARCEHGEQLDVFIQKSAVNTQELELLKLQAKEATDSANRSASLVRLLVDRVEELEAIQERRQEWMSALRQKSVEFRTIPLEEQKDAQD